MALVNRITAWSYSRYSKYTECPAAAKYKFIDKREEPGSAAMDRGDAIHKLAEAYVSGKLPKHSDSMIPFDKQFKALEKSKFKKLPAELEKFTGEFAELKASKPLVEEMWCFKSDWAETVWNDWNGIWCRIKTDAVCTDGDTAYVIDHKTGKNRGGYTEQMSLYGLGAFLKFPHIKKVVAQLWFLDSGDVVPAEFEAKDLKPLQKDWEKKVKPMLNDTMFAPRPGNACRFCHFKKANGGPCKF